MPSFSIERVENLSVTGAATAKVGLIICQNRPTLDRVRLNISLPY